MNFLNKIDKIKNWNIKNSKRPDCVSIFIYMETSKFFTFIRENIISIYEELKKDVRIEGLYFLCYPNELKTT